MPNKSLSDTKQCLVAVDGEGGPELYPLSLPRSATIGAALAAICAVTAPQDAAAGATDSAYTAGTPGSLELAQRPVGIWGTCQPHCAIPEDGDRIEVYRPLAADPRQRRRQRAQRGRREPHV